MSLRAAQLRKATRIIGAGALIFSFSAVPAMASTPVKAPTFTVTSAPDPDPPVDGLTSAAFTAVSAATAADALAVGPNFGEAAENAPFADHWDGMSWQGSVLPVPAGMTQASLAGVAEMAPGDGWAVGTSNDGSVSSDRTLIEHWNGTSWSIVPSPNPATGAAGSDELSAIVAISPTDIWAAGSDFIQGANINLLFAHYDGSTWTAVAPPPDSGGFAFGLTAVSSNDVWMVGSTTQQPITAHWNGTRWTSVPAPDVNAGANPTEWLTAATAVSPTDVWASGYAANVDNQNKLEPIVEKWNGSKWSLVSVPNPGSEGTRLNGITSAGPNEVLAVGTTQESNGSLLSLIERFNGTTWATIPSPDPGVNGNLSNNTLDAASAAGGRAWAVGAFNQKGQCCDLPLAIHASLGG